MATTTPDMRDQSAGWTVNSVERLFRRSRLFQWQLATHDAVEIRAGLLDHWRGSASIGSAILKDARAQLGTGLSFHTFEWLRDLRAFGGSQARAVGRNEVNDWLVANGAWHPELWRPDVMGDRLTHLAAAYGWFGESATASFQTRLAHSLSVQAKCLALDWRRMTSVSAKLRALRGLASAEAVLGSTPDQMTALLDLALPIVQSVLNPDGGHISRMPDRQITMLRHLIELRTAAAFSGVAADSRLEELITRMGTMCRMWRNADGQLAHFNGGGALSREVIEETLVRAGPRGKVLQQAPYTGFLRFSTGRSMVIMDAGSPPSAVSESDGERRITGLGTLSFEFNVGQTPLVVNAGQTASDPQFNRLLCSTSAHSTLALDDHNSSDLGANRIAQISGVEVGPATGGILAEASHDGYEASHGILHHRQVFLATGGGNLRGSDRLEYTGAPGEIPRQGVIRFHLHPKVSAAMLGNGRVLMKIRGSRAGWIFKAGNAAVSLDNSVYFEGGVRSSCQQIVLRTPLNGIRSVGEHLVKWAFQRNDPS